MKKIILLCVIVAGFALLWIPRGPALPPGLTLAQITNPSSSGTATACGSPTCTVSTAAGGNGVLALSGNTSGTATFTAPAIAGTSTNPVSMSNVIVGPNGAVGTVTYGFASAVNTGMFAVGGGPYLGLAYNGATGAAIGDLSGGAGRGVQVPSTGFFGWSSSTAGAAFNQTGISSEGALVIDFGNGNGSSTTAKLKASGYMSVGTKFTTDTGCGTVTSLTGGASAGSFVAQTSGACTVVITMGDTATAPNGWSCSVSDRTTANLFRQTASSATTATISGTAVTSDVISFGCIGY